MSTTFADLGIPASLSDVLIQRDITEPFPIQSATIPDALAGRDISGKAPTGSGKTLAFGLPLLTNVETAQPRKPRALILAPTRELAEQIKIELAPLARATKRWVAVVYGGVSYGPQKSALRKGVDVLVATPGRLEDLIQQGSVDLSDVNIAVIDEADRMADMGFLPAVRRILDQTNAKRQTLLFSATLDGDIAQLSRKYQTKPVLHEAESVETTAADANHLFWLVNRDERIEYTAQAIETSGKAIVFTRTRHGADRLAKQLSGHGVKAVAMHGGRSQNQRNRALKSFSQGHMQALVATDVAARGIHVDDVGAVIHFDPAGDSKDYVHRSGRTARAGATGTVISMVMSDQKKAVARMLRDLGIDAPIGRPASTEIVEGTTRPTSRSADSRPKHRSPESFGRSRSIYVGNLPWKTSDRDLENMFSAHGEVTKATVVTRNGKSKGYGFVDMPEGSAPVALDALKGHQIGGRELKIRYAR